MKTKLISILFALVAGVGTIFANGTKIGDLYYNLNTENLTAQVTYEKLVVLDGSSYTTDLPSVNIPSQVTYNNQTYTVTSIGGIAFQGCTGITEVSIPSTVTTIETMAFYRCSGLTSLVIPESVTSIGRMVFYGCTNLTSINIPRNLTTLEEYLFSHCRSLPAITIPAGVTSIGGECFDHCDSLTTVICEATTPPSFGDNVFENTPSQMEIIVPCGTQDAYMEAWSGVASHIRITPAVKAVSADTFRGSASVPETVCDSLISATANYGYHFAQWSDGNTDNPRTIDPMAYVIYTAEFAKNTYMVTALSDTLQGTISGATQAEYLDEVQLTAVAKKGYHFEQWTDGVTDNPRTIILTRDTTFTAEFFSVINTDVNYVDKAGCAMRSERATLYAPQAPEIEGFTFVEWVVVASDLADGISIQATYQANEPTSAPVVVNPADTNAEPMANANANADTEVR